MNVISQIKMPRLIGIKGLAGHGKDTVANFITDYFSSSVTIRMSFAEPLKEMVSLITGIPKQDIDSHKTTYLPEYGMTVRSLLQKVGTDAMRNQVHQNIWVNIAERQLPSIPDHQVVVIPDVRFENEMQFIRRYQGLILQVDRPGVFDKEIHGHVSESGQSDMSSADYIIVNDCSLEELRTRVYGLLEAVW